MWVKIIGCVMLAELTLMAAIHVEPTTSKVMQVLFGLIVLSAIWKS